MFNRSFLGGKIMKIKNTALGLVLVASTITVHASRDMNDLMNIGMDDSFSFDTFDRVRTQIEKVETELKQLFKHKPESSAPKTIVAKSVAPMVEQDDEHVYINMKVSEVDNEKMVVKKIEDKKGSYLTVEIPQENRTVEMMISKNTLTVATKHEAKEEKMNDQEKSAYYAFGTSRMMQSLPSEVSLEEPKAEYDQDKGMLTITLKKVDLPKLRVIPITKK